MDALVPIMICGMLFIGMPWLFLHYSSKFRAAKGISQQDEQLLDDLYSTARRLDSRLESIERIIAADNPQWKESALPHQRSRELEDRR
jgi:phage shock protein B